jgi:NhaA family Na+:H+ antiporter
VEFADNESTSGMILVGLSVAAMLWANLVPGGHYEQFWGTKLAISLGSWTEVHSVRFWINDLLMALFFLLMGLEIKREFLMGELSDRRKAAMPIAAALGGMLVPAGIYALLNVNGGDLRGTGVPMATDIAFSLGVLALVGSRAPLALKVLLAAIAIVDDLGAVLVIALFYTAEIDFTMLFAVGASVAVLVLMNRLAVKSLAAYFAVGLPLWLFALWSGVHPTVAGVLMALCVPIRTYINPRRFAHRARQAVTEFEECQTSEDPKAMTQERQYAVRELTRLAQDVQMPLERMEDALSPLITFVVVPLFALANSGVVMSGGLTSLGTPVASGVLLGLILGKPFGVLLLGWLSIRLRWASLPEDVTWKQFGGLAVLTGIGFTMSLFVAELAFKDPTSHNAAKLATMVASVFMGVLGFSLLRATSSRPTPQP